jgi:hypothetical protein
MRTARAGAVAAALGAGNGAARPTGAFHGRTRCPRATAAQSCRQRSRHGRCCRIAIPALQGRPVYAMDGTYQSESAHYGRCTPRQGGEDNPKGHALLYTQSSTGIICLSGIADYPICHVMVRSPWCSSLRRSVVTIQVISTRNAHFRTHFGTTIVLLTTCRSSLWFALDSQRTPVISPTLCREM